MKDSKILELINICKAYKPGEMVLDSLSLEINKGEIVAILGENGVGKSTLLKIIAGLDTNYSGVVRYQNKEYIKPSTKIVLLQQTYEQLFPWLTVEQNVFKPLMLSKKISYDTAIEKGRFCLEQVEIGESLFNRYPHQLSGGQKQKVAIARALALDADIMLMDEPFSAIDEITRVSFHKLIKDLAENGKTIIIVSHFIEEVQKIADKEIWLKKDVTKTSEKQYTGERQYAKNIYRF